MNKLSNLVVLVAIILLLCSCDKFINIVPDDVATIKKAFVMRSQAKQYLYTLYSYMPHYAAVYPGGISLNHFDPAYSGSQEMWFPPGRGYGMPGSQLQRGKQNVTDPLFNYWEGTNQGSNLYQAIRECNVFLKNIKNVGNMTTAKKKRWSAEAKFLKAYYYFWLTRQYGPVILYKHNVSVSAPISKIHKTRAPIDSTFKYIIKLLNEVIHTPQLPARITNRQRNVGRISKAAVYAIKAKVEVYWASPLFNGNKAYVGFKNKKGINPFDTKYDPTRWDSAAAAAKKAIMFAKAHNFRMYQFKPNATEASIDDTTKLKMTIRNSFALGQNKLNPGVLWYRVVRNRLWSRQVFNIPRGINHKNLGCGICNGWEAPPLKIVSMFYTNHGVPINQDKSWDYANRFKVQTVGKDERFNLIQGYKTAKLNMYRGPRFYADLGFDGSIWYGTGIYNGGPDKYHHIKAKKDQVNWYATHEHGYYSITGYFIKKLVNYRTQIGNNGEYNISLNVYNWPIMRLADLYLLYGEAKNEASGPGPQVYKYLNKVRRHAGLPTVQQSWSEWSTQPNQYKSKAGLRKIIHHERLITLAFEAQRFWDLRRWKDIKLINQPIRGWSRNFAKASKYYTPKILYQPHFTLKDYFWPISEGELLANPMLSQNPGWGR